MPIADWVSKVGKEGGKASLGKPKGGSTEWYVTEEVNPIDKTHLSGTGSVWEYQIQSCSLAGLQWRRILIFILQKSLHELMDQGGEW